jgi:hypothetical protein
MLSETPPPTGPSSYSNAGNFTPTSTSSEGSAFGQRKRNFAARLDDDASSGSRVKSRKAGPQHAAVGPPYVGGDFWPDDASVVDLTGYVQGITIKWRMLDSLK